MKAQKTKQVNPFTSVTLFSKLLAGFLFIIFPFVAFFAGMQYQKELSNVEFQSLQQFGESGIKGLVLVLKCNGVVSNSLSACRPSFYPGFISIQKQGSLDYQIIQADGMGNFTVYVDPGVYILSPIQKNTYLTAGSKRIVEVKKGEVSVAIVEYSVK